MPMYSRIKIAKRVKDKLPMVQPGMRDNSILPGSGGASNSGITLDYSAINMGGIDNGIPFNHADDVVEVKEEDAQRMDKYKKHQSSLTKAELGAIRLYNLGKIKSFNVWVVDGKKIRDSIDIDFTTGGNPGRYKYVPQNEIWIDNDVGENEIQDVVIHELDECMNMEIKHKTYDAAHDKANVLENNLRHENATDDPYNDDNKGHGAFVGSHEEGFALRHNLDYGSTANLTALIIKGNAKFVMNNATAEEFYAEIVNYLSGKGFKVSFDVSETSALAQKADLVIGHSNGLFKLNRCKDHAKLLAFGAIPEKATNPNIVFANHPTDEAYLKKCHYKNRYDYPIAEHFIFTNEMKTAIDNAIGLIKKAYPDYPAYSDPEMYTQVSDRMPATPSFNLFNTYYADDGYESQRGALQKERKKDDVLTTRGPLQREKPKNPERSALQRERPKQEPLAMNLIDDVVEAYEPEIIEVIDKQAFVKTAVTYDSNQVIQDLIKIPQVKALIDQEASGFVDKIVVTTPGADIQQTQQQLSQPNGGMAPITLEPISGNPYGHVWVGEDPTTHQKKPLDKIVRIDRVTDQWGTLVTILHEIAHHRHPDWSESQVESEAENHAGTVKQFLGATKNASSKTNIVFFNSRKLHITPLVECDLADTYQKQVIGLQHHSSLRPQSGLLFVYASPQPLTFWMGKVAFPIDIIFANSNNQIVKIYRNCQPNSAELYSCDKASKVIEVVGSFCAFHDIDVGDHVFYADDRDEGLTQHILGKLKDAKIEQQKDLDMTDWNIKIVMKKNPDVRRFLKVSWTPEDYKLKKADILVNPNPILIEAALKEMPLDKLIRHALLHILVGAKNELPEDKEQRLITDKLY